MATYRYRLVDVFTATPLEGNPLAVFLDALEIDRVTMQKIAQEMNLSETVFAGPPTRSDCAAKLKIFTPTKEMRFAGHPTIGASFVLVDEGIVAKDRKNFALEEEIGPVPIRVEAGASPRIWLATPPIHFGRTYDPALCAEAVGLNASDLLNVAPQLVSAGNPTIFIALRDTAAVDRAWMDMTGSRSLQDGDAEPACVFVFTPTEAGAYSRMFAPEFGVIEDPATGSSTGPLAAFMMRHGLVDGDSDLQFISEQGVKMGRRSLLHVRARSAEDIEVGGHVTALAEGTMRI